MSNESVKPKRRMGGPGGGMGMAPMEKAKDFKGSLKNSITI